MKNGDETFMMPLREAFNPYWEEAHLSEKLREAFANLDALKPMPPMNRQKQIQLLQAEEAWERLETRIESIVKKNLMHVITTLIINDMLGC